VGEVVGGACELAEALAGRLSSVRGLAALELGGVGGSIVRVREGQRQDVEAAGVGPGRVVVGVPEAGESARKRGGCGGRGRETAHTLAGHLPAEETLAARKLVGVARAELPVALALELAETVRPVARVSGRVPLLGLGAVAPGLGVGAVDAREKECNLIDLHCGRRK